MIDKTCLPDAFKLMSGLDFYLYFVSELIRQVPPSIRKGGTLIMDEFGSSSRLKMELRHVLKMRGISWDFHRVLIRRSHSEALIQVADLVAGAILRRDAHKQSEAFDYISGKIQNLIHYP